jgi:hypothetical protein
MKRIAAIDFPKSYVLFPLIPAHNRGNIPRTYDRNQHIFELMKMKLAQRLLIGYYKTKLKTIGLWFLSRKAAEAAFKIFCTPFASKPPKKIPPYFIKRKNCLLS